jgi:pimeloyl-ACP methyl ester carboxylesterase
MKNKPGIVLINGAGLNSSIWDDLKGEINFPVLAVEFPNRKANGQENTKLSFDDYVNTTIGQIEKWNTDNFIIVAHSIGACVGLKVAARFNSELKGFVAVSSVVPRNGHSFASSLPFPQNVLLPVMLRLFGTKPPDKAIGKELCNDLSAGQAQKIISEFTPESSLLYTTRINYDLPEIKRLYIKLSNDKALPVSFQDRMATNLLADKVVRLDSGHLPMISKPHQLSAVLSDFANNLN